LTSCEQVRFRGKGARELASLAQEIPEEPGRLIRGQGMPEACRRSVVGEQATYLSFDIDALDPAFAPGTGTPEVGGLATWQAQAILRRLENIDFIGMDVVEVSPVYDTAEITALTAATIVWEYLALIALSQ
jgi:arginase family enzyme